LQVAVGVAGLVPVSAGLAGVLLGPGMAGRVVADVSVDSHFRYLSGLLLGIGLTYWGMIPGIARRGAGFRLLTAVVFVGGVGRVVGVLMNGAPSWPMVFGLGMEMVVTPALCFWQWRVERAAAFT
jgi:hypothetical protein